MTRPARHRAARFVAVAILALAVATIAGPEIVTTGGADPQPPSTQALLPDDAVHGTETVGVQPPRPRPSAAPPASPRCNRWRS